MSSNVLVLLEAQRQHACLLLSFALSLLQFHLSALLLCTRVVHTIEITVALPLTSLALHAGYIGEFEFVDDHRGGKIVVELNGRCVCACVFGGVPGGLWTFDECKRPLTVLLSGALYMQLCWVLEQYLRKDQGCLLEYAPLPQCTYGILS